MWIEKTAQVSRELHVSLEREVLNLGSLQEVVRWAFALKPPRDIADVIVQDEYSHDVVIPWIDNLVLAFDTT
jgi:hypothetical protein